MAIRVAVAGLGARGQDWAREVKTAPQFELVACVDVNASSLRSAAARFEFLRNSVSATSLARWTRQSATP